MPNSRREGKLPVLHLDSNASNTGIHKLTGGRKRVLVLLLVHIAIVVHIAHFHWNGASISPVEPSESMYAIELGHLNAGAVFFGLAIISTAIFGRFFCGWACHIVALQDLCGYILRSVGIKPRPLRSRLLAIAPFVVAFHMFFWPTIWRIWQGNPHPGFTNHLVTDNFWRTFPGLGMALITFLVCGGLIVYVLGNKGFCTYACPYGAFFSIADHVSFGRIRVTDACHQCGQCTASCTSNVAVNLEVKDFGMVIDPGCMKCMDCVRACPNDALYYGFTPVNSRSSSIEKTAENPKRKKAYSFSIVEDIGGLAVAAATVYAMRGLYDMTPYLLSVALGVISAFLAIQFTRLFRRNDSKIQNLWLRRQGRITRIGKWAIALLCVWFTFSIHSFVVQYHRHRGRTNLAQIDATWEELLWGQAAKNFTLEDKSNIEIAINNFEKADQFGLAGVLEVKLGLAVANMMQGEMDSAENYFYQAYDFEPDTVREMLSEFLISQGREQEAKQLH